MKDWIPFLQELIWPIFIGLMIYLNRRWFNQLLKTIEQRVRDGSEFVIGPGGVSVGKAPALPDEVEEEDKIDDGYVPDALVSAELLKSDADDFKYTLSHTSSLWKLKNGRPFYRIAVTTHAESEQAKSRIEKVVYKLHPTFKNPIRPVITPENDFLLRTNGWGEFTLKAEVFLKGVDEPVLLSRYIELKA
jgi:hypothetical protein